MARAKLSKSNDQLVARYLHGLHAYLKGKLLGFYILDVPEIIPKAKLFESQLNRATRRSFSHNLGFQPPPKSIDDMITTKKHQSFSSSLALHGAKPQQSPQS